MGHLGNADRAECEGPNAEWFCRRLTEQLTQPKEASAIWKSARDAVKTAGMFYYELKPSLVRAVENNFIHYTTLKPPSGAPTTALIHEMQFGSGEYEMFHGRDTSCGCVGCSARPVEVCVRGSQVPKLARYKLVRGGGAGEGIVDDGGEEEEENFAALHGSKAGDIAAFDVKDAELSQDSTVRRAQDDGQGHVAWLMLLTRAAFPLSRPTRDSRRPGRELPAGTLVCEGHFLEYMHRLPRGKDRADEKQWERVGELPDAANAYYVENKVALLAVDVPGCKLQMPWALVFRRRYDHGEGHCGTDDGSIEKAEPKGSAEQQAVLRPGEHRRDHADPDANLRRRRSTAMKFRVTSFT